jgi:cysteine synthase
MIEQAEVDGILKPGATIIEASSGNTGIGLAMIGVVKGYHVVVVMSEGTSTELRKFLAAFGAEIVLTSAKGLFRSGTSSCSSGCYFVSRMNLMRERPH